MPPPRRSSEHLRKQLVNQLSEKGVIRSEAVQAAFLAVPREQFLPVVAGGNGLEAIYRDEAFQNYSMVDPPVHVIVNNGHVTLVGFVRSQIERIKAESIARMMNGVARHPRQVSR